MAENIDHWIIHRILPNSLDRFPNLKSCLEQIYRFIILRAKLERLWKGNFALMVEQFYTELCPIIFYIWTLVFFDLSSEENFSKGVWDFLLICSKQWRASRQNTLRYLKVNLIKFLISRFSANKNWVRKVHRRERQWSHSLQINVRKKDATI